MTRSVARRVRAKACDLADLERHDNLLVVRTTPLENGRETEKWPGTTGYLTCRGWILRRNGETGNLSLRQEQDAYWPVKPGLAVRQLAVDARQLDHQRLELLVVFLFAELALLIAQGGERLFELVAPLAVGSADMPRSRSLGMRWNWWARMPSSAAPSLARRVARTPRNQSAGVPRRSPLSSSRACSVASCERVR